MSNQTANLLSALASKLGITAKYLWAVEMKEAHVQFYLSMWQFVIAAFLMGASLMFIKYSFKKGRIDIEKMREIERKRYASCTPTSSWGDTNWTFMIVVSSICAASFLVWVIISLLSSIDLFVNPANFAFNAIANALSGGGQ